MSDFQKRIVRNSYNRLELLLKAVRDKNERARLLEQLKEERAIVDASLKVDVPSN
jgi:hypothetical protein